MLFSNSGVEIILFCQSSDVCTLYRQIKHAIAGDIHVTITYATHRLTGA